MSVGVTLGLVFQSKGGILSKACDYIRELRQNNQQLQESYKEVERVEMDNELLRQQVCLTPHTRVRETLAPGTHPSHPRVDAGGRSSGKLLGGLGRSSL